jgi:hypothetical protein
MSTPLYISRNFTEFGAFTPAEIASFKARGILLDSDFLRLEGSDTWTPLADWSPPAESTAPAPAMASEPAPAVDAPKPVKPKAAKTAATAKAAKKAAKKKASPGAGD